MFKDTTNRHVLRVTNVIFCLSSTTLEDIKSVLGEMQLESV